MENNYTADIQSQRYKSLNLQLVVTGEIKPANVDKLIIDLVYNHTGLVGNTNKVITEAKYNVS